MGVFIFRWIECDNIHVVNSSNPIVKAIGSWEAILGKEKVLDQKTSRARYGKSTLGLSERMILGTLLPQNREQIVALVKIANRHSISLYPISTGNNWGYGSASPVADSCMVVDLSGMNRIISVDGELGLATVEPGVTSAQLQEYFEKNGLPFVAPVTGAGSQCSIIGNALERGRGTSPYIDRFSSIMALEAVLSDGTIYQSPFSNPDSEHRGFFKWGIGPYIDGLFGQSNFGIVVSATFALAPRPEYIQGFLISVKEGESLSSVVESTRNSLQKLGSILPTIQIQNPQRVLTRTVPYFKENLGNDGVLSDDFIRGILDDLSLTRWTLMGVIQGNYKVVKAARNVIEEIFVPSSRRLFFFDQATLRALNAVNKYLPLPKRVETYLVTLPMISSFLSISYGKGMKTNPLIPFWRSMGGLSSEERLNFRKNRVSFDSDPHCGLIFFPAVLPMIGVNVESFVNGAEKICKKYGIEPIIGLLNFSDKCIYVGLPILFDKSSEKETSSALLCYKELFSLASTCDGYVHRAHIGSMDMVVDSKNHFWQTVGKIKKALDPKNILSPGRYTP